MATSQAALAAASPVRGGPSVAASPLVRGAAYFPHTGVSQLR